MHAVEGFPKVSFRYQFASLRRLLAVAGSLALALPFAARAADTSWTASGTGDWNTAGNWSNGIPDSSSVVTSGNGFGPVLASGTGSYSRLEIGSTGTGSLLISGGTLSGAAVNLGLAAGSSGTLSITAGTFTSATNTLITSGSNGTGAIRISGGTVSTGTISLGNGTGSGSLTISGGQVSTGMIYVGTVGTGSFAITSGTLNSNYGLNVGATDGTGGGGTATFTSGTSFLRIVGLWKGSMQVDGGILNSLQLTIATGADTASTFTMTSGTLNLSAATLGTGTFTLSGGSFSSGNLRVGQGAAGTATALISGGTMDLGTVIIGNHTGTDVMTVSGGKVGGTTLTIGAAADNQSSLTVNGGTLAFSGSLTVGKLASNTTMLITSGSLTSNGGFVGVGSTDDPSQGSDNDVTISGTGSVWKNTGNLTVGINGTGNHVTALDGGLLTIGDAVGETVVVASDGSGNSIRLDGGYIALFGDQTSYVTDTLLANGSIMVWDADISKWTTATTENLDFAYFATDAAALAATGYNGLGGYTILGAVPEPGTCALAALGLATLAYRLRRRG